MKIFVGCDAAGCKSLPTEVANGYTQVIGRPTGWWAIDFEGPLTQRHSLVVCPDCAERLGLVKLANDTLPKVKPA